MSSRSNHYINCILFNILFRSNLSNSTRIHNFPIGEHQTHTNYTPIGQFAYTLRSCNHANNLLYDSYTQVHNHDISFVSFIFPSSCFANLVRNTLALLKATRPFLCIAIYKFNAHFIKGNAMNLFHFSSPYCSFHN